MDDEKQTTKINIEDIWWIYIYLIPKFLNNEGKIISVILEYGGIIKDKIDLYKKVKENKIDITYQTLHTIINNLLLKEILVKDVEDRKSFLTINKKYIDDSKQYRERILSQIQW